MKRGRWTYRPEHQAWELDDSGWYLTPRTGVMRVFRGCSCCWHLGDDRRWVLHKTPPDTWKEPRTHADWRYGYPRYRSECGYCTHRRRLADAMPLVEEKFAEHVLNAIAKL